MPTFRIHTSDGEERTFQAERLRTDAISACWKDRSLGRWSTVMSIPLRQVAHVQRRLVEPDGRCTWITELPLA